MYLAKCVGGWSTTQIGKFYNGRDHSTVCYAIQRIEALRELNPDVDCVLTALKEEIRTLRPVRVEHNIRLTPRPRIQDTTPLISEELLDTLAERIADRVFSRLGAVRQVQAALEPL
jgi:chromosomal replication initiation ATPase DnaA